MEAELRESLGAEVELDAGSGGVFEVWVEQQLVYDKASSGRFPEPGEVLRRVRSIPTGAAPGAKP